MRSSTFNKYKRKALIKGIFIGVFGLLFLYLSDSQYFTSFFLNHDVPIMINHSESPLKSILNILRILLMVSLEVGLFVCYLNCEFSCKDYNQYFSYIQNFTCEMSRNFQYSITSLILFVGLIPITIKNIILF